MFSRAKMGLAAAGLVATTLTGLLTAPANASSPPICTTNAPSGNGCLNRDGGGTGNGTPIIFWHNDGDANNNFAYGWLSTYCGFGTVNNICPFNNTSIDNRYFGDKIYELYATNVSGKCVAAPDYLSVTLQGCGAVGYLFVRSSSGYLVSVGSTNHFGTIEWLTGRGAYGTQVTFTTVAFDTWTSP